MVFGFVDMVFMSVVVFVVVVFIGLRSEFRSFVRSWGVVFYVMVGVMLFW